jgi:O-antigen/teichoic acid export membrane protein
VSTAFFALLGLALVLAAVFAAVYPFVPWEGIFNVSGQAAKGVGAAAAAFAVGVFLALPLGVVQRAEIGMQEMFIASAWQAMGRLVGLAGVIVAVAVGASLPYLVLALAVSPALALAGNGVDLFFRRRRWLRPSPKRIDRDVAGALLRIGSFFFVLQIAIAVAYESDALVLTQVLGPAAVTTYSVTMRVFLVVPALANFVLAPLWPAYGEAISRGDIHWVRQTLRRAVRGGLFLTIAFAAVLALVARPLINAWAGVEPPYLLIAAAGIWVIVMTLGAIVAAFLNGARVIRAQIVAAVTMMIANLGLSILFTHWLGVSGVIWGSIAAEGAAVVVLLALVVPSVLSRLESRRLCPVDLG